MENKKFDLNSLIGFLLIGGILVWMLYLNKPSEEEILADEARIEAKAAQEKAAIKENENLDISISKSRIGNKEYETTIIK